MKLVRCMDCALKGTAKCGKAFVDKKTGKLYFNNQDEHFYCSKGRYKKELIYDNFHIIINKSPIDMAKFLATVAFKGYEVGCRRAGMLTYNVIYQQYKTWLLKEVNIEEERAKANDTESQREVSGSEGET